MESPLLLARIDISQWRDIKDFPVFIFFKFWKYTGGFEFVVAIGILLIDSLIFRWYIDCDPAVVAVVDYFFRFAPSLIEFIFRVTYPGVHYTVGAGATKEQYTHEDYR
jgi:hypothetical protein